MWHREMFYHKIVGGLPIILETISNHQEMIEVVELP